MNTNINNPSITKIKTLGEWGKFAVEKHFRKILKHETEVIKDSDPEGVHQIRVGMRRLRSAISAFNIALDLPKAMDEAKIAKTARILGELRDLDVLKAYLISCQIQLPKAEQKQLHQVLEILAKQRKQALEKAQSTLKTETYINFKQAAKKWLLQPVYKDLAKIEIIEILPDLILPSISKLFLHSAWLISADHSVTNTDSLNQVLNQEGETLHNLRKVAKKVRYLMELFTEIYGDDYQKYLQDCKDIQAILGAIQDSIVLENFVKTVIDDDLNHKMPKLVKILEQNRYESWQKWQSLQQKYLDFHERKQFYLTILNIKIES
jgi:CHAD domain-containing protein